MGRFQIELIYLYFPLSFHLIDGRTVENKGKLIITASSKIKSTRNRHLGKPRLRWENNIRIDFKRKRFHYDEIISIRSGYYILVNLVNGALNRRFRKS